MTVLHHSASQKPTTSDANTSIKPLSTSSIVGAASQYPDCDYEQQAEFISLVSPEEEGEVLTGKPSRKDLTKIYPLLLFHCGSNRL